MLYEEILEYLQLSRRLAERSGQPSDEEITENSIIIASYF